MLALPAGLCLVQLQLRLPPCLALPYAASPPCCPAPALCRPALPYADNYHLVCLQVVYPLGLYLALPCPALCCTTTLLPCPAPAICSHMVHYMGVGRPCPALCGSLPSRLCPGGVSQ